MLTPDQLADYIKTASVTDLTGLKAMCEREFAERKNKLMRELNQLGGFAPPKRAARAPRSDKGQPRLRVSVAKDAEGDAANAGLDPATPDPVMVMPAYYPGGLPDDASDLI